MISENISVKTLLFLFLRIIGLVLIGLTIVRSEEENTEFLGGVYMEELHLG